MGFSNNTTEVLALYFIFFFLQQMKTILFNENGLMFRGVMPECIFVLLGPWNRYRSFWKMKEMQWVLFIQGCKTYEEYVIVSLSPNRDSCVWLVLDFNLNGGCMSSIVNHCQLQWHDPQSCIYCFSLNDFGQVLESRDVCSGPLFGFGFSW